MVNLSMSIKYGQIFNNNAQWRRSYNSNVACFLFLKTRTIPKQIYNLCWLEIKEIFIYQSQNSPPDYPCHSFQKLADDCIEMAETINYVTSCSPNATTKKQFRFNEFWNRIFLTGLWFNYNHFPLKPPFVTIIVWCFSDRT